VLNIIVVAYNSWDLTEKCIESILNKTKVKYRIIFINNCSTDDTDEKFIEKYINNKKIEYVKTDKNEGCGIGRNYGLKKIDKDCNYVIILDNDIIVTPNWDIKLIKFMEEHPEVGLCGPCTNFAGSPQLIKNIGSLKTEEEIDDFSMNYKHVVPFTYAPEKWPVIGFCMVIRKKVIDDIGFFDENFKFYGCEDNDFCYRVEKNGWKLAYVYTTFIYHKGHGSLDSLGSSGHDWVKSFEKNKKYFEEKNGFF